MPDDPYSLADLARLADVTPRTVRYYVAQGLLPSPDPAGPATRYGEGHLLRLRLIRHLQREHLPLAEIRARLGRMEDDEVRAILDAGGPAPAAPPMDTAQTLAHVRALMAKAGVAPRFYDQQPPALAMAPAMPSGPMMPALRDAPPRTSAPATAASAGTALPAGASSHAAASSSAPDLVPGPTPRGGAGDRSTWERLALTSDVELHVRRPLDRATNKRVERLVRIARELFDDAG